MDEKYYIFVGCAHGQFETEDTHEKRPFANMFVLSPVGSYESEDYHADGYKAEKLKCLSPNVWKDLSIGEKCSLYFTDKRVVALATSRGEIVSLEP